MTGLEIAGAVMSGLSAVAGVVGSMQQARAQRDAAKYNEQVAQRNRAIALANATAEAEDQAYENRQTLGAITAAYGASGVTPDGTPLDVLGAAAREGELDIAKIEHRGRIGAMQEGDRARLFAMERRGAGSGLMFSAAGSILRAGASIGSAYYSSRRGDYAAGTA